MMWLTQFISNRLTWSCFFTAAICESLRALPKVYSETRIEFRSFVDRNASKGVKSTNPTLTIDILDYCALLRGISFFGDAGSRFFNGYYRQSKKPFQDEN